MMGTASNRATKRRFAGDNSTRRRRGCDAKEHARIEEEALAELNGNQDTEEQPEGHSSNAGQTGVPQAPGYPQVMHAIQTARDADALAAAGDLLNYFAGPDDQRKELAVAFEHARIKVNA